jgi:GWxTD domain-containing protein
MREMMQAFLSQLWVQKLGWTLLHFLWQGTAIAVVYATLRGLLDRTLSAQGRYVLACLALAAIAIAPPVTFFLIQHDGMPVISWSVSVPAWQPLLPGFVAFWLAGVLVFSARLCCGWRFTTRLRSTSHPAPAEWQHTLEAIARRIKTSRPVRLLVSSLVEVPTVIGWLRPVILVPMECLTGLPAEHISALLAHEMAHIRRHDYLASILQSTVEAVLFYHPAVWWISGQMRAEREACCDDLAVAACGDVLTYARALAELESHHLARRPALAANGGSLVRRIRRLIEPTQPAADNLPGAGAAWAMTLLWMAGIGVATVHGAQTPVPMPRLVELNPVAQVPLPPQLPLPAKNPLLFDPFLSAQLTPHPTQTSAPEAPVSIYSKWLDEDVAYIITVDERAAFLALSNDNDREQFVEEFWSRRDKAEHYRRIGYANEHFGASLPGWRTDRGHVYIVLGPPDEMEAHPGIASWRYHHVDGLGNDIVFDFTDPAGTGEFRVSPGQRNLLSGLHVASLNSTAHLPMQVRCDYYRGVGSSVMVNITIQFEDKDLQVQIQNGVNRATVNLFGRVTSMTRRPIATFEPTLEVDAPTEGARQVYQQSVPLLPGRYHLNIVAKDIQSGNTNVYESALDVPHFDEFKLMASSLVLADAIEKLPAKSTGSMFAIGDDMVRPRLGNSFGRGDKMGVYLQLYNFTPDAATQKPVGTVEYEVDAAGSGERVLSVVQDVGSLANASASQVTIEKLLPLNTLAPGNYTLKVTATDARSTQTVQRLQNFTVTAE